MISQADATLSPATTTTGISTNHHHLPSTTTIHAGKNLKGFSAKKRKKFDETIVDGFAIVAFKTWEDLQDELNERSSLSNNNTNSNINADNANNTNTNDTNNSYETNTVTAVDRKSKSKHKSSSTSSSANLDTNPSLTNPSSTNNINSKDTKNAPKKKEKSKKSAGHSPSKSSSKDKRNKSSTDKTSLEKALEAKELAEKRLSILQEKLKHEQSKNKLTTNNNTSNTTTTINNGSGITNNNNTKTGSNPNTINGDINNNPNSNIGCINSAIPITNDNHSYVNQFQQTKTTTCVQVNEVSYSHPQTPIQSIKEEIQQHHIHRTNGMLGTDLLKDPTISPTKASTYTPFHISSHLLRPPNTAIHQTLHQFHNPPSPTTRLSTQLNPSQSPAGHQLPKHTQSPYIPQHSVPTSQTSHLIQHKATPPPQPQVIPQHHSPFPRQTFPQLIPAQPQLHPYTHTQSNSMISTMGLSSLPSPYSCPPSIYITDTISRQTSIIPPPAPTLLPVLDQSVPANQANRFGHPSVLHSMTPYNPAVPPHHSMYYPTLPTERSFIEFARSYTGPGHLGYPNLMNSFPTPAPNITANPYSFDRWPRMALDQQRAVSRYSSLYQSTTTLPDRNYTGYSSARPPSFPAGIFVSNLEDFPKNSSKPNEQFTNSNSKPTIHHVNKR